MKQKIKPAENVATLLADFSLEMTGKDTDALKEAAPSIPEGTRINVTFLGNEDLPMRVEAARLVRSLGFTPVPHISARRLKSQSELEDFLTALQEVDATEEIFVVGGDPAVPAGPYADSLEVIRTGILPSFGVRSVSIAGYPEGHPDIARDVLRTALVDKSKALTEQGLNSTVITQFGFDTAPVIKWLAESREQGVESTVRIGLPGPAGVKRLLGYARRFGVQSSAGIVQKYGFSLTNLLGTAGPGRFITDLANELSHESYGDVKVHFYTFGGMRTTADWIADFQENGGIR